MGQAASLEQSARYTCLPSAVRTSTITPSSPVASPHTAHRAVSVLSGLPALGIVLGQLIGAHPVRFLLGDGAAVLAIGVVLCCLGLLWSDRIIARAQR